MITNDLDGFASASGTDAGAAKKRMQSGGWRDLEGQFMVKSSGADRPTFAVTLNGLYGYRWSPTTMQWERTIMIDKDTLAEWGELAKSMFGRSYANDCDDEHCGHCAEAALSGAWDDLDA